MPKIGTGISDFRKIIETNNFYADKSLLIKDLIDLNDEVTLITRPRRFVHICAGGCVVALIDRIGSLRDIIWSNISIESIDEFSVRQFTPVDFICVNTVLSV